MSTHPVVTGVLDELRANRSVVLHGRPGSGRSRLARSIAAELRGAGRQVVDVSGSDGTAAPLAPFAPILLAAGVRPGDDPALSAYTRLPPYLRAAGAVVVVDDAHLLDGGSGVLVSHLDRAGVPLVLIADAPTGLHPSVRDRLEGPGWSVCPIPPASADEILSVAAEHAGGELTAASGAALLAGADGRPAVAVALLRAGAATRSTPGGIEIEQPFPVSDEVLRWSVDPAGWTVEVRRAAELAAVATELPLSAARAPGIDAALAAGVLVETAGSLRFARELERVVVLGSMPSAVAQARAAQAHELLGAAGAAWSARAALLAVRAGLTVPCGALLAAAQDARLTDAERVEVLAPVPDDDPAGLVLRAAAASTEDRVLDAEALLDRARAALAEAPEREPWLLRLGQELGLLHAVRLGNPARAVAEVGALLATITDPAARDTLSAELVKWRLMAGEAEVAAPPRESADVDAAGAVGTAVIGAMIASLDGSREDALAEVDSGLAALRHTGVAIPHAESLLQLSRFLALVFDGDLTQAADLTTSRRDAAARTADPELGMWEYAAAELALHCGRLDDAAVLAGRAVRHLAWRDFTGLRPTADALLLAVRTRRGGTPGPGEPAAGLDPADVKVALHLARVEADRTRDVAGLLTAGRRALAESHANLGVMALDEAWMLTRSADLADELVGLVRQDGRGGVAAVLAQRLRAHRSGSAQAMTRAAEELEELGLAGRAADSWELAARLHREAGRHDSADRCVRRGILLRSARGLGQWPAAVVVLSPRETEIARLAAERMRSREIGEQLGLSVRTVDNHLARIYRKLGVSGRDELVGALVSA